MQDRKKLLSFVIVGGGPTGVEVAAEMYDMITQDMARLYPKLTGSVKIRVIELMDHVLSTYDRKIGDYTGKLFKRNGIELVRAPASAQCTGIFSNIRVVTFARVIQPVRPCATSAITWLAIAVLRACCRAQSATQCVHACRF